MRNKQSRISESIMDSVTETEITAQTAERLLDDLSAIVARASAAILAIPVGDAGQRTKDDQSPVTKADEASEAIILDGLARLIPGLPVIAEESAASAPNRIELSCAVVDPLDGTKEFLAGRDEYTVNIGIVTRGVPIAGVISAPLQGLLWRGVVGGKAERLRIDFKAGAHATERTAIRARTAPAELVAAISRTHLDARSEEFLSRLKVGRRYGCGSSVKLCHLAQGDADIYPRLAPTCEWDIAAGCAILTAAGGKVTDPAGGALRFASGAEKFLVPGFIAWGDPALARSA
jgi:3'(2'), 5'-bisphosphate nucleotidase